MLIKFLAVAFIAIYIVVSCMAVNACVTRVRAMPPPPQPVQTLTPLTSPNQHSYRLDRAPIGVPFTTERAVIELDCDDSGCVVLTER